MRQHYSAKQISFASIMGAIALLMQLFSPGIALYWGGKAEMADVPAVIGAFFAGPIGAIIIGILYGLGSPTFLGLIPVSVVDFVIVSFLLRIRRFGWVFVPIVHLTVMVFLGGVVYNLLFSIPLQVGMALAFSYNLPGALVSGPVCGIISAFRKETRFDR